MPDAIEIFSTNYVSHNTRQKQWRSMRYFHNKSPEMGAMAYFLRIHNNNLFIKHLHGEGNELPEVELKEVNHCGQQFLV